MERKQCSRRCGREVSRPLAWRSVRPLVLLVLPALLAGCGAVSGTGSSPDEACTPETPWPEQPEIVRGEPDAAAREALADVWGGGPNFACSALLVTWSCGSGCVTGGIYDGKTGVWAYLPFAVHRDLGQVDPLLDYTRSSSLLTATGWLNETEHGVFRYRWDGAGLALIEPRQ